MGFARKMRKGRRLLETDIFMTAARFDEGAIELHVGEGQVCRRDFSSLEHVRAVQYSKWNGRQVQFVCPVCRTKYVQFVPSG